MDCAYRIRVTSGKTIRLTFKEFLVEPDFDYITVSFFPSFLVNIIFLTNLFCYSTVSSINLFIGCFKVHDGPKSNSKEIARLSGTFPEISTLTSSSNWLVLHFHSDNSFGGRWEANYEVV